MGRSRSRTPPRRSVDQSYRGSHRDYSHRDYSNGPHDRHSSRSEEEKLARIRLRREEDQKAFEEEQQKVVQNERGIIEGEASKSSFIRYKDDEILNQRQRQQGRWEDPARYFVKELQQEKAKVKAPPNRFDILPGQYWDGIDRSNGFEMKLFQQRASKLSIQELAHRHDYEDL